MIQQRQCSKTLKLISVVKSYARLPKINSIYDPEAYKKAKEYDQRVMWGPFEGQRLLEDDEQQ